MLKFTALLRQPFKHWQTILHFTKHDNLSFEPLQDSSPCSNIFFCIAVGWRIVFCSLIWPLGTMSLMRPEKTETVHTDWMWVTSQFKAFGSLFELQELDTSVEFGAAILSEVQNSSNTHTKNTLLSTFEQMQRAVSVSWFLCFFQSVLFAVPCQSLQVASTSFWGGVGSSLPWLNASMPCRPVKASLEKALYSSNHAPNGTASLDKFLQLWSEVADVAVWICLDPYKVRYLLNSGSLRFFP